LGLVVAIQLFTLPIYHGALFADRKVRILAHHPFTLKDYQAPFGIIDRTSENITLLGRTPQGKRSLIVIPQEQLKTVAFERIIPFNQFIDELDSAISVSSAVKSEPTSESHATYDETVTGEDLLKDRIQPEIVVKEMSNQTFIQQAIANLRITFEDISSLSESAVEAGELWMARIDAERRIENLKSARGTICPGR